MKHTYSIIAFALASMASCVKVQVPQEEAADSAISSVAKYRSYDDAMACAQSALSFLGEDTKSPTRRIVSGTCVVSPATKGDSRRDTLFYAFNYADNAGFAIINADNHGDPFICITEKGSYTDGDPTGVEAFDAYIEHVKEVLGRGGAHINDPIEPYDPLDPPGPNPPGPVLYSYTVDWYSGTQVYPLLNTNWGKLGVYGAFCPNGAAGCVARAIAQVMMYYRYPSSITLSTDMGSWTQGTQLAMPWSNIAYHTCNHTNTWPCTNYHDYISALLYDVSERVGMTYYSNGSSGAYFSAVRPALSAYGYQSSPIQSVNSSTLCDIKTSLDNRDPVIMSGIDSNPNGVGHAWVVDGYKDYLLYRDTYAQAYPQPGYYLVNSTLLEEVHALHINWGWDGECNGYFNFGTYNTAVAYSYDGNINTKEHNYTSNLEFISDIRH